jgi:hypothetical protein
VEEVSRGTVAERNFGFCLEESIPHMLLRPSSPLARCSWRCEYDISTLLAHIPATKLHEVGTHSPPIVHGLVDGKPVEGEPARGQVGEWGIYLDLVVAEKPQLLPMPFAWPASFCYCFCLLGGGDPITSRCSLCSLFPPKKEEPTQA